MQDTFPDTLSHLAALSDTYGLIKPLAEAGDFTVTLTSGGEPDAADYTYA